MDLNLSFSLSVSHDSYKSLFLIFVFLWNKKVNQVAELRRQIELKEVAHEGMVKASNCVLVCGSGLIIC